MKIILGVEGEVRENPCYTALKKAFPNLLAANTPNGIINFVNSSFGTTVVVLDEDFFLQAFRLNPFFKETLRGLAYNNNVRGLACNNNAGLHIIVFHQKGKHIVGYQYGADFFINETRPAELPRRIRGIIKRNRIK